jgi:hypothetical protein
MPETQPVLLNLDDIRDYEHLDNWVSRFNYGNRFNKNKDEPNMIFKPYSLTVATVKKLEDLIQICDDNFYFETMDFPNAHKYITRTLNDKLILHRPRDIANLLQDPGTRLCGNAYEKELLNINKSRNHFIKDCSEKYGEILDKPSPYICDTDLEIYQSSITILGLLALVCRSYFRNTDFKAYIERFYLSLYYSRDEIYDVWVLNHNQCRQLGRSRKDIYKDLERMYVKNEPFYNDIVPYTFKWRDD